MIRTFSSLVVLGFVMYTTGFQELNPFRVLSYLWCGRGRTTLSTQFKKIEGSTDAFYMPLAMGKLRHDASH